MKKLNPFDASYYRGKNYFDDCGTQNYYIFQPISKYLKQQLIKMILIIFYHGNQEDQMI